MKTSHQKVLELKVQRHKKQIENSPYLSGLVTGNRTDLLNYQLGYLTKSIESAIHILNDSHPITQILLEGIAEVQAFSEIEKEMKKKDKTSFKQVLDEFISNVSKIKFI